MNRHDDSETKKQYETFYLPAGKSIEKVDKVGGSKTSGLPLSSLPNFCETRRKRRPWVLVPQSRDPHYPPFEEDYGVE
jgi:hypothetical protein